MFNTNASKTSLGHFAPHVFEQVDGPIRVRATQKGFYNNTLRHPGDEFGIHTEEEFSDKWMVKVAVAPHAAAEETDDLDDLDEVEEEKPKSGKKSGKKKGEDDVL